MCDGWKLAGRVWDGWKLAAWEVRKCLGGGWKRGGRRVAEGGWTLAGREVADCVWDRWKVSGGRWLSGCLCMAQEEILMWMHGLKVS